MFKLQIVLTFKKTGDIIDKIMLEYYKRIRNPQGGDQYDCNTTLLMLLARIVLLYIYIFAL